MSCPECPHSDGRHGIGGCGYKNGNDIYCDCTWDPGRYARTVAEFPAKLLELWDTACEIASDLRSTPEDFAAWSGATKDVLIALGMHWDNKRGRYVLTPKETP